MLSTQVHLERRKNLRKNRFLSLLEIILTGYAIVQILFIVCLWINHAAFPLNLEAMELTILQHLRRLMAGLPLYPEPTADFVALAYNPLYYYLCIPFAWLFGTNLFTMRLVAILGMLGSGIVIFLAVQRETKSTWWGLMATGLFAAAYRAMDTYLDNAHRDSWLLFMILLGCLLINQKHNRFQNFIGIMLMVSAFWFKQQGAIFCAGSLLYLTWRDGWRQSWHYWLVAGLLGPVLYLAAPDWLFGSHFHYFTWQVPRQWVELKGDEIRNFLRFIIKFNFILAIVASVTSAIILKRSLNRVGIWYFMFPIAVISGIMAVIATGSNNNVFIPMGVWFIIVGTLGLEQLKNSSKVNKRWQLHLFALGVSFLLLFYNPISVISSPQAGQAYQDFVTYLKSINGSIYAPWIGELAADYKFYPAAHWVAIYDLLRGPGINEDNHPITTKLLASVLNPPGKAYLLQNQPLEEDVLLSFLSEKYILETDLGDRFKPLANLPRRFSLGWPRYLYRYSAPQGGQ